MGTRHLTVVKSKGIIKVAQYGQWDGYPSGQGRTIMNFIKQQEDMEDFAKRVNRCKFISESALKKCWKEAGASPESNFVTMDVSKKFLELYPQLSRDTGAKVLSIISVSEEPVKLTSSLDFAEEGLFC